MAELLMRTSGLMSILILVALLSAACSPNRQSYAGPGCLIHLYTLPNLQGSGLPVERDTPELAEEWRVFLIVITKGLWVTMGRQQSSRCFDQQGASARSNA